MQLSFGQDVVSTGVPGAASVVYHYHMLHSIQQATVIHNAHFPFPLSVGSGYYLGFV